MRRRTRPLELAVVGCGYWGLKLLEKLSAIPGTRVAWCCDMDAAALARASALSPQVRLAETQDELLSEPIDAAFIATPAATHFELAAQLLESGCDLFVEKPLATSCIQVEALARLAERGGRILAAGHQYFYSPAFVALARAVAAGRIGRPESILCTRTHLGLVRQDVHAAWDLAPHDIGMVQSLTGETPREVQAMGLYIENGSRIDAAEIVLRHDSGVRARVRVSWSHARRQRRLEVRGPRGELTFDEMAHPAAIALTSRPAAVTAGAAGTAAQRELLACPGPEPLALELEDFIRCVRHRARPRAGWRECLEIVRVLEAADQSMASGGAPVRLIRSSRESAAAK